MAKANNTKPTFGRKMIPCEYNEKWANKLPKEQVVTIVAEDTVREKKGEEKETR